MSKLDLITDLYDLEIIKYNFTNLFTNSNYEQILEIFRTLANIYRGKNGLTSFIMTDYMIRTYFFFAFYINMGVFLRKLCKSKTISYQAPLLDLDLIDEKIILPYDNFFYLIDNEDKKIIGLKYNLIPGTYDILIKDKTYTLKFKIDYIYLNKTVDFITKIKESCHELMIYSIIDYLQNTNEENEEEYINKILSIITLSKEDIIDLKNKYMDIIEELN